jgi:hypothetical protein
MLTTRRTLAFGAGLIVLAATLVGCTSTPPAPTETPISCDNSSLTNLTLASTGAPIEVQGAVEGDQVTGPFRQGVLVRTILDVTGDGPTTMALTDEAGAAQPFTWGPIQRVVSTLGLGGVEYSAGITPNSSGCWTLTVTNTTGVATLVFPVQKGVEVASTTPPATPAG